MELKKHFTFSLSTRNWVTAFSSITAKRNGQKHPLINQGSAIYKIPNSELNVFNNFLLDIYKYLIPYLFISIKLNTQSATPKLIIK